MGLKLKTKSVEKRFIENFNLSDVSKTFPENSSPFSVQALSIMRAIASQEHKSSLYLIDKNEINAKLNLGKKVFCKFYLASNKNHLKPLFFMLDSGSDISLINRNLVNKLLTPAEINTYRKPCTISVESFSNHSVKLEYNLKLPWKFGIDQTQPLFMEFSVFNHTSAFPILVGQDNMALLGLSLSFPTGSNNNHPTVQINHPLCMKLPVKFIHPIEAQSCFANITIKPHDMKTIIFQPHELSNVKKGETYLVSESNVPYIYILPSKCEAYSVHGQPLVAQVFNLTSKLFTGRITGRIEDLDDFKVINSSQEIAKLPPEVNMLHEVLDFQGQEPFVKLKQIHLLNNLPIAKEPVSALKSYLLLTPFESKNNNSYALNPEKSKVHQDLVLDKLQKEQVILSKEMKVRVESKLQSLPFSSDDQIDDQFKEFSEIPADITLPEGYTMPEHLNIDIEDIVKIEEFEPIHQPYIEDIFIKKFPEIVSLHNYDIGNLSQSLGLYHIQLKPGEVLPRFRKVYYLSTEMRDHMRDILDFLIRYKIISRAKEDAEGHHLCASPAYLVGKSDKSQSYRLIIDYRLINRLIACPVPIIPDIVSTLHNLQNQALFTLIDLSSAYFSVGITPECRHLTTFACPLGKFVFEKLPMGLSSSPALFQELALKMIHYKPKLNETGEPIFSSPNHMELIWDPILQTTLFFDDLLVFTPLAKTYNETVKIHYSVVEKVMSRLALHQAKIGFKKSVFGQSKIKYLGWIISNNYIEPDQQRVAKLLNAPFPVNQKAMRSFTALLNTIKIVCPHTIMTPLKVLLPLTGSTTKYIPTGEHHKAFEELKGLLTKTPLFSNIIAPHLPKILFTDASASNGASFSAVLGQVETLTPDKLCLPKSLSLQDPVHQIIYNRRLCFEPIDIYFHEEFIPKSKLNVKTKLSPIPNTEYLKTPYLGFSEEKVKDSLFISIRSIQYNYQCKLLNVSEMRKNTIKRAGDSIVLKHKILD